MKTLILISGFLFLYSCRNSHKADIDNLPLGRSWNITLQNQLGNISIILPNNMDTLISWTQTSDCGDGCSYINYRIQSQKLPIFKESGFLYFPLKDSVEQFTIKHSKLNYTWQMPDTLLKNFLLGMLKSESKKYPSEPYIIDTIVKIDKRYFPILGYMTHDSIDKTTTQYLIANTALKDNLLQFFFEYRKSRSDSSTNEFIKNSLKYLKTVRINNGR